MDLAFKKHAEIYLSSHWTTEIESCTSDNSLKDSTYAADFVNCSKVHWSIIKDDYFVIGTTTQKTSRERYVKQSFGNWHTCLGLLRHRHLLFIYIAVLKTEFSERLFTVEGI